MMALDAGHHYELFTLDGDLPQYLSFVKRMGEKYPDNYGSHQGTNCQDVIRCLIDRVEYLNDQVFDSKNLDIIGHLRGALQLFEDRAAERHGRMWPRHARIERRPFCRKCGHVDCKRGCR